MPHYLDVAEETGKAAMFSVSMTPWHGHGAILHAAPSLEEALRLAGQNFNVATRPLFAKRATMADPTGIRGDAAQNFELVDGYQATYRTDRGTTLGVVGSRYTPLQNADAFGVLAPLLDSGLCTLETGGTLRDGRDVWMMIRFNIDHPDVLEVYDPEGVIPFGLLSNNHGGTRQVAVQLTPIRVVCYNTLRAAHSSGRNMIKVRHTSSVEQKLTEAAAVMFSAVVDRNVQAARAFKLLRARHYDTATFRTLVLDAIAPLPKPLPNGLRPNGLDRARAQNAEAKRERLTQLWTKGKGHTGDFSAFEAYNGAIESLDHDADLWKAGDRIQSMFDGRLNQLHRQLLDGMIDEAAWAPETAALAAGLDIVASGA